jgi:hypothetical protein
MRNCRHSEATSIPKTCSLTILKYFVLPTHLTRVENLLVTTSINQDVRDRFFVNTLFLNFVAFINRNAVEDIGLARVFSDAATFMPKKLWPN